MREEETLKKRTLHRDATAQEYGLHSENAAGGKPGGPASAETAEYRTEQTYQGGYRRAPGAGQNTNASYIGNAAGSAGQRTERPPQTGAPSRPSAGKRAGSWLVRLIITVLVFSAAGYIGERAGWFTLRGSGGGSSSGTLHLSPIPTPNLTLTPVKSASGDGEKAAGTDSSSAAGESDADQTGTDSEDTGAASDFGRIRENGVLLVGVTDYAPLDYIGDDGNWTGFDADLARSAAEALGVEAEFVEIDWDEKQTDLDNQKIDVIWNGLETGSGINTTYMETMDCTDIYCAAPQVVVLNRGDEDLYGTIEDLGYAGLTIAVGTGTQGEAVAKDLAEEGIIASPVSEVTEADAIVAVVNGSADAAIIDLVYSRSLLDSYPDLTWKFPLTDAGFRVGCRKGSDLPALLNDVFYEMYKNGTLESLAESYGLEAAVACAWDGSVPEVSASSGTAESSSAVSVSVSSQAEGDSAYPSLQQWLAGMSVPAGDALCENDFYYYDTDEYGEGKDPALKFAVGNGLAFSDEGNIVTARGIQNGSSADEVSNAYGTPSVTGTVSQNSVFYRLFHDYEDDQETVERILGKDFWGYIWDGNYLEFVFDENGTVIAVAFDSSHSFLNDSV